MTTIYNFDWEYFWDTFHTASVYEIGALVCFGSSWHSLLSKALKSGKTAEKGSFFLWLATFGVLFGILYKLFVNLDVVIFLYLFWFLVVFADSNAYRSARRRERAEARKSASSRRRDVVLASDESAPDSFWKEGEQSGRRSRRRSERSSVSWETLADVGDETSQSSHRRHSHIHRHRHSHRNDDSSTRPTEERGNDGGGERGEGNESRKNSEGDERR